MTVTEVNLPDGAWVSSICFYPDLLSASVTTTNWRKVQSLCLYTLTALSLVKTKFKVRGHAMILRARTCSSYSWKYASKGFWGVTVSERRWQTPIRLATGTRIPPRESLPSWENTLPAWGRSWVCRSWSSACHTTRSPWVNLGEGGGGEREKERDKVREEMLGAVPWLGPPESSES